MSSPDTRARRARALVPLFAPLLVAALVGGCSALPREPETDADDPAPLADDFPRSRRVALDFVDAMTRTPALAPEETTLYATRPPSRFGELLLGALQRAGYDLRLQADNAAVTLDYAVRAEAGRYTFSVRADGIGLERSYVADTAGIRPVSTMRIDGHEAKRMANAPVLTPVPLPAAVRPVALPDADARISARPAPPPAIERRPATSAAAASAHGGSDTAVARVSVTKLPPLKRNLYETRRSNYADLLVQYDTVRREIMVFPNDSLVMGRDNKRLARRIAADFDPERDVISVIGCSHGRTALENGNETLATGRSYRVKEAFMLAGIDADLVLEEGCWAGTHFDKMPARGVVVTHKRRAAAG